MIVRLHRAIAADAPSWRFCRGVMIGFVAGSVLVSAAFRGRPDRRVHTIVDPPATYAVAALG
jgi:hypothetical protein